MTQGETQPFKTTPVESNTVRRILQHALDHFSQFGYSGASIREITQACNVTKPTLYYYFKNKEDLYNQLAQSCFAETYTLIKDAASSHTTAATRQRVYDMLGAYTNFCRDRLPVARFVHLMTMSPDRGAPDVGIAGYNDKVRGLFRTVLEEGVQRGEVTKDKVEPVLRVIYALLHHTGTQMLGKNPAPADLPALDENLKLILP